MNIALAAGGRFHAFHLARQLYKRGMLTRFFSAGGQWADQDEFRGALVNNELIRLIDQCYFKLRINHFVPQSSWYVFKDGYFDRWLSQHVQELGNLDIFVGWAHYVLESLPHIRQRTGAKIIIECGSMHIDEHAKILQREYERLGLIIQPVRQENRDKIKAEYEAADFISVPSEHVKQSFMKNGVDGSKLLKVPYGVDIRKFCAVSYFRPKKFSVIFAGRICLGKGIEYLLRAWKRLGFSKEQAELVLVGHVESDIQVLGPELLNQETVFFAGSCRQEELASYYTRSSLFVLPSLAEGLAMVIAEAMSSGLPILATTNSGACELIQDGEHGFIVPTHDELALAEKILWFHDNQNEGFEMGRKGQRRILEQTWDQYGEQIVRVYESIL